MSKIYVDLVAFKCFVLIILYLLRVSQQLSANMEDLETLSGACKRKTSFYVQTRALLMKK